MATPLPGLIPLRRQQRPPKPRRPPIMPRGSLLIQSILRTSHLTEFTNKPDLFPGTLDEWMFYVAMAKVTGEPLNYHTPPFWGGASWGYQLPFLGTFSRQRGSAVVDFVYYALAEVVAIRIVTEYHHLGAPPFKKGTDVEQKAQLGKENVVIDVYSPDYLDDDTGQAVVIAAKMAIGMLERPSPIETGRYAIRI